MPDPVYLGLFGPDGELKGNGYRRVELGEFQFEDSLHGERVATNLGSIEFPAATGTWNIVTGFGIFDSRGQLLFHGSMSNTIQVLAGDTVTMSSGNLRVQWNGLNPQSIDMVLRGKLPEVKREIKTLWERLEDDQE